MKPSTLCLAPLSWLEAWSHLHLVTLLFLGFFVCKLELWRATSCHCHTRGLGSSVMGHAFLVNSDLCLAPRMSLRTLTLMEKKRHHRRHPRLATPLPTFRGKQLTGPKIVLFPLASLLLLVVAYLGDGKGRTEEGLKVGACARERAVDGAWAGAV